MKKFIVYLLVIILTVSLGFAIFYLVRDNEVISISSASIYKDAGDSFTLDINHTNKKSYTEITVSSSDEDVVNGSYDKKNGQYKANALKGGVARINVRTTNAKFRNLWCDVIVGDGTVESPYYISTAEQLSAIGMGAEIQDENGVVQRKALNSQDAQTLCGASLSTIVTESDSKIPTSQAVLSAIAAAVSNAINNLNTTIQAKLNDKAPKYTYGTTDLIEGTSTLPAGTLYFYYTTD